MATDLASPKLLKVLSRLLAVVALGAASLAAQASPLPLEGRDINGNPVAASAASAVFEYDPNLNITWLRDWNVNGELGWGTQVAWAAGLTYFGGGWRLPITAQPDTACSDNFDPGGGFPNQYYGSTCTGSEMGYMWYTELGNTGSFLTNTGDFLNMQSDVYWSGTEYAPLPSYAWYFGANDAPQGTINKANALYAVAVRPGDVAADVPEPATLALLGLGLAGLGYSRRRRN